MRRSGKTTRLIDQAVQHLFEHGYIRVLMNSEIYREDFYRGFKTEQIEHFKKFIDPDSTPGNRAQLHFLEALSYRLAYEHGNAVERISEREFKVK